MKNVCLFNKSKFNISPSITIFLTSDQGSLSRDAEQIQICLVFYTRSILSSKLFFFKWVFNSSSQHKCLKPISAFSKIYSLHILSASSSVHSSSKDDYVRHNMVIRTSTLSAAKTICYLCGTTRKIITYHLFPASQVRMDVFSTAADFTEKFPSHLYSGNNGKPQHISLIFIVDLFHTREIHSVSWFIRMKNCSSFNWTPDTNIYFCIYMLWGWCLEISTTANIYTL